MAVGEPAGFGYWIGVLVESAGLDLKNEVPKEQRGVFRRLARFLVANDFDHVDQLRGGERDICSPGCWCACLLEGSNPRSWPGSGGFLQTELDLLMPLVRGGRSRSPARQQHVRCMVIFSHGLQLQVLGRRRETPVRVDVQQILTRPLVTNSHAVGCGPRVALRKWQSSRMNITETAAWLESARLESILGSCQRSLPSVRWAVLVMSVGISVLVFACTGQEYHVIVSS